MCRIRSEELKNERILSVVFNQDLGLCVELGDEKIDNEGIWIWNNVRFRQSSGKRN